jgi:hypothetical protein
MNEFNIIGLECFNDVDKESLDEIVILGSKYEKSMKIHGW